jgi:hypothetical protein
VNAAGKDTPPRLFTCREFVIGNSADAIKVSPPQ